MTNHLPVAFQSPALGWLTIAFLLTASIVTYTKRIDQYKRTGSLPAETPSAPAWFGLFFWAENGLKIVLIVLNWQFGLVIYMLGFALAVLGVLEHIGSILVFPFVRTALPDNVPQLDPYSDAIMQGIVVRWKRNHFRVNIVLTVAAYIGITLLLNSVRKEAAAVFVWGLIVPQLLLYLYIFALAAGRSSECGLKLFWLFGVLAVLGRVNDFEILVIPIAVVTALIISEIKKPATPSPLVEQSPMDAEDQ